MTWFRVDDQLPDNRKFRSVRRSAPAKMRDIAPFGIWAAAGAWSDDGWVPLEILLDWDDDAEALAARLVKAKLWYAVERDGERGYVFHDWHDQNPTRDDNDPSSAGTFGNHIRWHVQGGKIKADCPHCPTGSDHRPDVAPIIAPTIGVIGGESLPSRPVPTRPDPTETPLSDKSDEPDRFDEFWDAYDKKAGRKKCEVAYRAALKKPGVTDDLLIAAAAEYVAWVKAEGKHPAFTKNPLTWLHGEHWRDERSARTPQQSRPNGWLAAAERLYDNEPARKELA